MICLCAHCKDEEVKPPSQLCHFCQDELLSRHEDSMLYSDSQFIKPERIVWGKDVEGDE